MAMLSLLLMIVHFDLCWYMEEVTLMHLSYAIGAHYNASGAFNSRSLLVCYEVNLPQNLSGTYIKLIKISKYKQPSFTTVLQRALLCTYITTSFG
jgi:hypothetical protein